MRAAALIPAVALAAASAGCGVFAEVGPSTCSRSAENNPETLYTQGTVEGGVYMSSPWSGARANDDDDLLYFPGGMRYDIRHQLGVSPRWWQLYLSFDREGTTTGTLALAAGNQAEVRDVTDERLLVVNGSCVEYWLLVVAGADGEPPEGPP
jgi:hypothetical protein